MSIIERIVQIMDTKHLNQSELCKILNIQNSTFSTWKTRKTDPPAKYLILICEFLDVSVDYLLGRTDEPKKINYGVENHGDNNGAINNQVNSANTPDGISKEMLVKFEELNFTDKVKVMSLIAELSEKKA